MIIWLALTVAAAFTFLVAVEYITRKRRIHPEITRKVVHMTAGCVVATWPFYFTWRQIAVLGGVALVVVIASNLLHVLRSVQSVGRQSLGEVMFALAITAGALTSDSRWVFAAAMLHLGLADGSAAVAGRLWGRRTQYTVFGNRKSIVGTAAFFVVSVCIMLGYFAATHQYNVALLIAVPVAATVVENLAAFGADNLAIALIVVLLLNSK